MGLTEKMGGKAGSKKPIVDPPVRIFVCENKCHRCVKYP